jgi:hypothetical protein
MRPVAASTFSPDASALILGHAGSVGLSSACVDDEWTWKHRTETHGLGTVRNNGHRRRVVVGGRSTDRGDARTRSGATARIESLSPWRSSRRFSGSVWMGRISRNRTQNEFDAQQCPEQHTFSRRHPTRLMLTMGNLRRWITTPTLADCGRAGWLQEDDDCHSKPQQPVPTSTVIDHPAVFVNRAG